ncbi:hypothetical protein PBY51_018638 [Eleginops maclovinus]|uniref:Uncharacterized protein n=1 Tax=Eleginops maclovinus TaxID=56733 RepID=A0AAN8AY80_ELEMC|nr:hypothetical protein PBY51_018638 [Eleginops maclovinus]
MKCWDHTTADPSFIKVTAQAVAERSLCCPGWERNAPQHSLTCRSATPSILHRLERGKALKSRHSHTNTFSCSSAARR